MDEKKIKAEDMTLPDAVIIEIFSRLPVKSLCRFKCVSKFFLSFIQDSFFIDKTLTETGLKWLFHLEETIDIFSIEDDGVASLLHTFKFENHTRRYKYRHGLISYLDGDFGFCLYNLTTNEGILLPEWCQDFEVCFDPSSDKYKILGWREDKDILDFQVLTLEKDLSWRPVENTLELSFLLDADTSFGGKLFWHEKRKIISFNFANEKFTEIALPVEFSENNGFAYSTFEFEGSLVLVEQRREDEPVFSLWMLKDVDGSNIWNVMKRNLSLPLEDTTISEDPDYKWTMHDSNFSSRGGEIVITISDDIENNYVFFYCPLNGQFKLMTVSADLNYFNFKVRNYEENYLSFEELE